jgi:hypothetical protein
LQDDSSDDIPLLFAQPHRGDIFSSSDEVSKKLSFIFLGSSINDATNI